MTKVDRRGVKNPNAVLTPTLVVELKRMHALGFGSTRSGYGEIRAATPTRQGVRHRRAVSP